MIDYSDYYLWIDPLRSRPVRLTWTKRLGLDWIAGVRRGDFLPLEPIVLIPNSGSLWEDILWTGGGILVVSQRLQTLFREGDIKGWSIYPVEVYDRNKTQIPGYSGLSIIGRVGGHDVTRGEVILKPPVVPEGRPYEVLKGFFFEDDFWDGNEICYAGESGYIVVVKRVVDVIKKAKIKNVKFTPVLEHETDKEMLKIVGHWRS